MLRVSSAAQDVVNSRTVVQAQCQGPASAWSGCLRVAKTKDSRGLGFLLPTMGPGNLSLVARLVWPELFY